MDGPGAFLTVLERVLCNSIQACVQKYVPQSLSRFHTHTGLSAFNGQQTTSGHLSHVLQAHIVN